MRKVEYGIRNAENSGLGPCCSMGPRLALGYSVFQPGPGAHATRNAEGGRRNNARMQPTSRAAVRQGISLIEVLISMFVLLFGLMGAASLFPVGSFYAQKGEQYDLGSGVAQAAFDQIKARGMLRPEEWVYAAMPPNGTVTGFEQFLQPSGYFNALPPSSGSLILRKDPQGHAFVIDPIGAFPAPVNADIFPYHDAGSAQTVLLNPWSNLPSPKLGISGERWPIRRLTLMSPDPVNPPARIRMPANVAETIFRLRDELSVEQPEEDDHPATQLWEVADLNSTPTPDNPTDDTRLIRQYQGNYTWIATIVPKTAAALAALQPADPGYGSYECEVSVVVFRSRDVIPSAESERLVNAVLNLGGEIEMYIPGGDEDDLDTAFKGIRLGNWIAVMGVHQVTGTFMLKWYRLLGLDRESEINNLPGVTNGETIRRAMLDGPDWPFGDLSQVTELKVALLPGVIGVVTRPMTMERDSLWGIE
jgi:hypothetical protein